MAHIEKRGPGRWRARYRGPDGRERSKTFDRKVDADRWVATMEADKARGQWIDPRFGRTTLAEWVERWQATTVNLRPSTRVRDESYLRTHVLPRFGAFPLAAIVQVDVRAWVAELSAAGKAPATVKLAYGLLAKALQGAVDAGLIVASPCQRVSLPRVEREEMRFLTQAEVGRLADAIHPRYRALVLVGAYGGLRIGELAGLRRSRVDLFRGRVEVTEIAVEVRGQVFHGPPKTRAGRRTVALPRSGVPVVPELEEHLRRWAGDELVFPAPAGGILRTPTWRRRFWQPAVRAAGVEPLRPHDLRHTAVAMWIAAGANVKEVATRAGHTSVAFTLDRYGHLYDDADEALRDRLDAMLAREPDEARILSLPRPLSTTG